MQKPDIVGTMNTMTTTDLKPEELTERGTVTLGWGDES